MQFWSIESLLLGLGAVILAVDQGLANSQTIRSRFPEFRIPGWVRFVPFLLWAAAGVVWLMKPKATDHIEPAHSLVSGVDLKHFAELSRKHTNFEFSLLMKPFKSAPVMVSGVIEDISSRADGYANVRLADTVEGYAIDMDFKVEASKPVFRLIRGSRLSAKCEFGGMGSDIMAFVQECELVAKP